MVYAENKYKTLILEGKWNALSPEQTQIVALTTQLTELKSSKLRFQKGEGKGKGKGKNKDKTKNNPKSDKPKKPTGKNDKKWAWKTKPQKDKESQEKEVNGVKYFWCDWHKLWTRTKHTVDNCNAYKTQQNATDKVASQTVKTDKKGKTDDDKLKGQSFASQLEAIMKE